MSELWQKDALIKIKSLLEEYKEVEAVVLKGSCADKEIKIDKWSDIDLVIVVNDDKINNFFPCLDWILPLGEIFAVEQYPGDLTMTTRVCLHNFMRFDLVFIQTSRLKNVQSWNYNPFGKAYSILFTKVTDLHKLIMELPDNCAFSKVTQDELDSMANKFWFLGVMAIVKLMRGDYIISSHLALEMAQQCLVLQMIQRDHEKGTNIHRVGEREPIEIFQKMNTLCNSPSHIKILEIIMESGLIFDRLYKEISEKHDDRINNFSNWISEASENMKI